MRSRSAPWQVAGVGVVAAALATLLFLAYQLVVTGRTTGEAQQQLTERFDQLDRHAGRAAGAKEPAPGRPVAELLIPRLGPSWRFVVVQGVGPEQLALGPGHVPGTAMPGQRGNFAIAGHRVTHLHPFRDLDEMRVDDAVHVRFGGADFTYRVTGTSVAAPTDVSVIAPVKGQRRLTLITSTPEHSAGERLVVAAVMSPGKKARARR